MAWQQKALREAKLFSDWAAVDETYEDAARRFTLALIAEAALPDLLQEIAALVRRIAPAGAVNGLVQCLLRLTVPGVPDLYQGTEFWDFSLVDPDNRRPVDFAARAAALGEADLPALAAEWRNGGIKQALIAELLALRRRAPQLFAEGSYEPVAVEGEAAASMIAFVRRHGDHRLLVAAPRLPLGLLQGDGGISLAPHSPQGHGAPARRRHQPGPAVHDSAVRPVENPALGKSRQGRSKRAPSRRRGMQTRSLTHGSRTGRKTTQRAEIRKQRP